MRPFDEGVVGDEQFSIRLGNQKRRIVADAEAYIVASCTAGGEKPLNEVEFGRHVTGRVGGA